MKLGLFFVFVFLIFPAALLRADSPSSRPYAGKFSDGRLTVELGDAQEGYKGTLTLNNHPFPAQALIKGPAIEGTFESDGHRYTFTATIAGDTLVLITDATTYTLKRSTPAVADKPVPADAADGQASAPPGYFIMARTAHGQAWGLLRRETKSASVVLSASARDLLKSFDGKPTFGKAFVDDKDEVGTVAFATTLKGRALGGKVLSTTNSFGVMTSIIFQDKEGDAAGWEALSASVPVVPVMNLVELPGDTGTIALPTDWKMTGGDPVIGSVVVEGPQGERVLRETFISILTPQGRQAMHPTRAPTPEMMITDFLPPAEALEWLVAKQRTIPNLPWTATLDKWVANKPIEEHNPRDPDARKAAITYEWTKHQDARDIPEKSISTISTSHNPPFSWSMEINSIDAPAAIFNQRLLVMMEIYQSYKVDMNAVAENSRINNANIIKRSQDQLKSQQARFEATQQTFRAAEQARHAGAMRTVEMIRGVRAVDDTRTGQRTWEDLNSVDKIVAERNAAEGYNRYKETPLELDR